MARINTNISALIARGRLDRTNADLQTSLTRLSTGLRINTGKDDPAGLIASEALRSDITSLNKAISNTNRAVQVIATADSALNQVSTLLNNIRGLVVEAANRGAISPDEVNANQLQIDSSLEAINRISQTTTFQGRKLLDGSLDFLSNVNTISAVKDARINQANLGTTGKMDVHVEVIAAATQAELTSAGVDEFNASAAIEFGVRASDVLTDIEVVAGGITDPVTITFAFDSALTDGQAVASFNADTNTITVSGNETVAGTITRGNVADAINALAQFSATAATPATAAGDFTSGGSLPANATVSNTATIDVQADTVGNDFNNVRVVFEAGASNAATYDANTKTITATYVAGTASFTDIATAIDGLADFSASASGGGALISNSVDTVVQGNTLLTGGGVLQGDLVFELVGSTGSETFNFQAGTTSQQVADAINLVSDATGVTASVAPDNTITFNSSEYGSKSILGINVISEEASGIFEQGLSGIRAEGVDIKARVNGIEANGDGNQFSISTSTLIMSLTLDPNQPVAEFNFRINGGGAMFQLGGDVVSNQQARLGIHSMSTSTLGGPTGRLYELGTGQGKALLNDIKGAGRVIDEVINKVTSLRGRLGAFQATTLEGNLVSIGDTVSNLTEAESSIRDADFAAESARLTRAQILVQSGTAVLSIANQNPQNVLSLLR